MRYNALLRQGESVGLALPIGMMLAYSTIEENGNEQQSF